MSFATDKAAALPILQALDCDLAAIIDTRLTGYDDLVYILAYLFDTIQCYPTLLQNFTNAFDQTERESRGIYYANAGPLTDPKIVVNSTVATITYTTVDKTSAAVNPDVLIIGPGSVIDKITVDGGYDMAYLAITPGGRVKLVETSGANTVINNIFIYGCAGAVGTLDVADQAANITSVVATGGGWFGGYNCLDPDGACAAEVSALVSAQPTYDSMLLAWTAASESIRTRVYYRINNDTDWKEAEVDNGDGVRGNYRTDGTLGYAFKGLKVDTYYDFKVVNICNNGIASAGVILAAQKTESFIPASP